MGYRTKGSFLLRGKNPTTVLVVYIHSAIRICAQLRRHLFSLLRLVRALFSVLSLVVGKFLDIPTSRHLFACGSYSSIELQKSSSPDFRNLN